MYFYHAHAIAFGGRIGPNSIKVDQGSCALAVTGGASSVKASNFTFKSKDIEQLPQDITIGFDSAESEVTGTETSGGVYVTTAKVTLRGLNIKNVKNVVTADIITAQAKSTYTARDYEAAIGVAGAIQGLKINGADKEVVVTTSDDLNSKLTTYGSVQVAFQNRFSQPLVDCLIGSGLTKDLADTDDLKAAYKAYTEQAALLNPKSAVVCSLVKGVSSPLPQGATSCGGPAIIKIDGFGNLYLGEVIVWPWMRCLNMFRIELVGKDKKSVVGSISGASVGANGTGFPPGAGPLNGNGW